MIKEKLNDTENKAEQWLEKCESAFNFACYAKEHFNNGSIEDRKNILKGIGSNFILKSGIISLTLAKPFLIFKESKKINAYDFQQIELPEKFVLSTKTLQFGTPYGTIFVPI